MGSWGYEAVDGDGPLDYLDFELIKQIETIAFGCAERMAQWDSGSEEEKISFATKLYTFFIREVSMIKDLEVVRGVPQACRVKAILVLLWKDALPHYALWRELSIDVIHQIKLEYADQWNDPQKFRAACESDADAIANDDPSKFLNMRPFGDLMKMSAPVLEFIKRFEGEIGFQAVDLDSIE